MYIHGIYISPASNYWSHPMGQKGSAPTINCQTVECHAGKGIKGDRFYDFKENYKGQITFMQLESLEALKKELNTSFEWSDPRRNVIVTGIDPFTLCGRQFKIDDCIFEGICDCSPCGWMDKVLGPGSFDWLRVHKKGGLRAKILQSGTISVGSQIILF